MESPAIHHSVPTALRTPPGTEAPARTEIPEVNGHRNSGFSAPHSADAPVEINGGHYLRIRNVDRMPPFLMSVVSDSDFWLFVGSNGGFTAGRVDPDHAIFPYQTADRILDQPKSSGVSSLLTSDGVSWEPWTAECPQPGVTRNLYKHVAGTSVIFEEIHEPLGLAFRWELAVSGRFGLVRTCRLENLRNEKRSIRLLDGWHHLLPNGVSQETYARYSYLAAAYMRHESAAGGRLGIYTLNSGITDRAEPSESLRVTCAWSLGLDDATLFLSDKQADAFRRGGQAKQETEVRGVFGAHLLATEVALEARGSREWFVVADIGLDHTQTARLNESLRQPEVLRKELVADLAAAVPALERRIAGAGAFQQTADTRTSAHHFANVLFNCMRGGTLHDNYSFPRDDFRAFLKGRNQNLLLRHEEWIASLPDPCTLDDLTKQAAATQDAQLARLAGEYLPLCFSRRHGDPSRPWNRFEIHTRDAEGRPLFAYAGNWRDIFQNWESLAYSYPLCFGPMISIFLNASTADGYNPYRITRAGIDWEVFDPHDPWSHIGYWGDHQIIYLLRLLEGRERFQPGRLTADLNERRHAHANVPYEIKDFDDLVNDPKHSIRFNVALHKQLMERARTLGGDAKLATNADGSVVLVSLAEKLLVPVLVKLSNLVPGGGIWLNTQRPEWNDANNALAGWGLSVVTVCHLRRYLAFFETLLGEGAPEEFDLSRSVAVLLEEITAALPFATAVSDDAARLQAVVALGRAGEKHRREVYARKSPDFTKVGIRAIRDFISKALATVDATLSANQRGGHLFHSYNLLEIGSEKASVHHLDLMLEGQVAALSSGVLTPGEAVELLESLRRSPLYREDQNSYLLYPDRAISPFLERNILPADWESRIPHLAESVLAGDRELLSIDDKGLAHFHADFTNTRDLVARLAEIEADPRRSPAVSAERDAVLELWEEVFHHRSFTGRSGAMFGFEGLGSIYWHMVAKLLLAVQEVYLRAARDLPDAPETTALAALYEEVRNGLGFTKDSETYGAFPTDPYSHSPRHGGAQQPGMTGQVKEEILTRLGELGVTIENGCVGFRPTLLRQHEFFTSSHTFDFIDVHGQRRAWKLGPGTLAFTAFQVPVCYELGGRTSIRLQHSDGAITAIDGDFLTEEQSNHLFERDGSITSITVVVP